MSSGNAIEHLAELLDRQFDFVSRESGVLQLLRLRRLLSFLYDEPLFATILTDLQIEADEQKQRYKTEDARIRDKLKNLWSVFGGKLQVQFSDSEDDNDVLNAYGSLNSFEDDLAREAALEWEELDDSSLPISTGRLVSALSHWHDCAKGKGTAIDSDDLSSLKAKLTTLDAEHQFASRRLEESRLLLGWTAYKRLEKAAKATNPQLSKRDIETSGIQFVMDSERATSLRKRDERRTMSRGNQAAKQLLEQAGQDIETLHEELRLRLGQRRSRLGLVRRYAAGCEAFRAEQLRTMAEESNSPEAVLALDFARYLFEAGLNPLLDTTVSGLRPDILHVDPSALFYVEAKQYKNKHPRSVLRKAYGQVWSTWARLQKIYPSQEAFLVVFRRSGPYVSLPEVVTHDGLKLYSVLVDISDKEAGSRESKKPLSISADEAKPQKNPE